MEAAVYEDCRKLVEGFIKAKNPHFKSFCEQWKLMVFHHIYSVQSSVIEVIQTTMIILHAAKRLACGKNFLGISSVLFSRDNHDQFLTRIAGVYLLYTIYFKQPTKQYVKVQVNPETWKLLYDFIQSLTVEEAGDEVSYMFWLLCKADAFRFTAMDYHVGLEGLVDYDSVKEHDIDKYNLPAFRSDLIDKLHKVSEIQNEIPNLTNLEDKYNAAKTILIKDGQAIAQSLPSSRIFHNIQRTFKEIGKLVSDAANQQGSSINDSIGKDDDDKIIIDDSTSHETVLSGHEEMNSGKNEVFLKRSLRRMSCRSIFIEKLPDNVLNDLSDSTSEDTTEK